MGWVDHGAQMKVKQPSQRTTTLDGGRGVVFIEPRVEVKGRWLRQCHINLPTSNHYQPHQLAQPIQPPSHIPVVNPLLLLRRLLVLRLL